MVNADTVDAGPQMLDEIGLDSFAPYLMNRIIGRYNEALGAEIAALGLTTAQMRALAVLSVSDGILIRELAVYAVVKQSTLSRALDALETAGMIRREIDACDSRATRIFLTDAGHAAHLQLWPHMADAYHGMFEGIEDAEKRVFVATLQRMLRNVRRHEI